MPLFSVNSRYEADLWRHGLRRPDDFLVCTDGVAVGQHARRQVRRVTLGDYQVFLKREQPVQWKNRLEAWLAGYGWVSKSQREWQILLKLRERGLPCPEPLAVGEVGNMAFLVVRGLSDSVDLPTYLAFRPSLDDRHQVLRNLGHTIADLHNAGFTHPDLYAKHVFIHRPTLHVSFVDFQRTCIKKQVSLHQRCLELSRLDASLHPGAVPFKERLTFLHAYLHRALGHVKQHHVRTAAVLVAAESSRLLRRRRIQAMHAETALLSGDVSVVTYCRIRVPEGTPLRASTIEQPHMIRGQKI